MAAPVAEDVVFEIDPTSSEYDEYRGLFNRMIDTRPARIALCDNPGDVAAALLAGQAAGLDIAVRAGGHSVSGLSSVQDGLVVDVRPMKQITVDPSRGTASVQAGVTWGELDRATARHGYALTGGRATSTGVAGFTLGGGDGWLSRSFGLACDSLVGVDLVTADGRHIRATESENPELFWGLHGGGGNFGVATRFDFRLHRMSPNPLCGVLVWPMDAAVEVVRAYRDLVESAPRQLGTGAMVVSTDDDDETVPEGLRGGPIVLVVVVWTGDPRSGRELLGPLLALEPAVDGVVEQSYVGLQDALTDPPGYCHYWSADYHDTFPDEAVDVLVRWAENRTSKLTQQVLFAWGGAISDVGEQETPMAHRRTSWVTHPFAVWENPSDSERHIEWARGFRRDMGRHTNGGVYLNFIGDEGQSRVKAAYGESTYARLAALKAEWDPTNIFHRNQNIRPAT